jgi:hypothetical protein
MSYRGHDWSKPGPVKEVPFDPDDSHVEAAHVIIEAMDLDLDKKALVVLLRATRHAHRMALSDWKRRNDPEWKVPRALPRGRRIHKYDEHMEGWPEWWASIWGRRRSNPGRFRGTTVAVAPLVEIYHLCNRWWRRTLGTPYRPDFRAINVKVPDAQNMPHLNDAARLFLLVAQDAGGPMYNCDLCSRVHDANYRRLDTTIP